MTIWPRRRRSMRRATRSTRPWKTPSAPPTRSCGLASLEAQPGRRAEMLDAAAAVLETTRLPFDSIERAYYLLRQADNVLHCQH